MSWPNWLTKAVKILGNSDESTMYDPDGASITNDVMIDVQSPADKIRRNLLKIGGAYIVISLFAASNSRR